MRKIILIAAVLVLVGLAAACHNTEYYEVTFGDEPCETDVTISNHSDERAKFYVYGDYFVVGHQTKTEVYVPANGVVIVPNVNRHVGGIVVLDHAHHPGFFIEVDYDRPPCDLELEPAP